MKIYVYYYLIINVITFIIFGLDKFLAIKNKRRISEKTLFILSLTGGCFLQLTSMFIFRHKTKKVKFYIINTLFIILHIFIIYKLK